MYRVREVRPQPRRIVELDPRQVRVIRHARDVVGRALLEAAANLDFEKAVEALFDLRIIYMEIWSGHFPVDSGEQRASDRRDWLETKGNLASVIAPAVTT